MQEHSCPIADKKEHGNLSRSSLLKHLAYPFNACCQNIDFFFRIVKAEGSPDGTFDAKTNHQRLSTMMTSTNGNAQPIKQRTHIEMMDITHQERNDTTLVFRFPEDAHTFNLL